MTVRADTIIVGTCPIHRANIIVQQYTSSRTWYSSTSSKCYKIRESGIAVCSGGTACNQGGAWFRETEHDHSWGSWVTTTQATCTSQGVQKKTCSNSSSHVQTQNIPMKPHTMTSFVVENKGSCTSSGNYEKHCSSCNGQRQTQTIPARGHVSWTSVSGVADGSYKRYYCNRGGTSEYHSCSDLLHTQYRGRVYVRKENLIGSFTEYALTVDDYRDYGSAFAVGSQLTDAQFAYSLVDGVSYSTRPFNLTIGSTPKTWYVTEYRKKVYINYDRGQAP